MDYKEKYEHGFECIQEILSGAGDLIRTSTLRKRLQPFFPELNESEDERMRKALKQGFSYYENSFTFGGIKVEDIIAWLEKQGEQDMIPLDKAIKFLDEQLVDDKDEVTGEPFINFQNYGAFKETFISFFKEKMLEKRGGTTNKIEPKFCEGDWLVEPRDGEPNGLWHIERIEDNHYWEGSTGVRIEHADKYYHLWTIKDAKEGDVLTTDNFIFIFKSIDNNNGVHYYCHYEISKHEDDSPRFDIALPQSLMGIVGSSFTHYKPATKEQRDLLFQKMKESGYEWDNGKKELKKVEQKPDDNVEPKFKVGDWIVENDINRNPVQITSFEEDKGVGIKVWFSNGTGTYIDFLKGYHLWTIADAKDGDVLVDEDNNIGLYLEEKDDLYWHSCIYIGCDNCLRGFGGYHNYEHTKPATKEQRDMLFQKMKETGYEWDSEKKELKKIEQNPAESTKDYNDIDPHFGILVEDLMSTDKVEPKFKVRDWCIDKQDGTIFRIEKVMENTYDYKTDKGNVYSCTHDSLEFDSKLWTINDAKDGDVLTNGKIIVIFKQIVEPKYKQHIEAYIGLDLGCDIQVTSESWSLGIDKAMPATKEQRELLFQKMKEAGYEWDSEKKELKKMEVVSKESEDERIKKTIIRILKGEIGYTSKEDIDKYVTWLEKQDEQKPTDKTKPKFKVEFKVGDWIVGNDGIFKITQYEDEYGYELTNITGCVVHFVSPNYVESNFHLWTIQDAKDGDVLVSGDVIFIFNNIHGVWVNCHCSLRKDCSFKDRNYDLMYTKDNKEVYPATKEQRDALFAKMKEAGYEWDADKKELKKIEPNKLDADNILPYLGNNQVQDILEDMGMLDDNYQCSHTAEEIFKAGMEYAYNLKRKPTSSVKLDPDKVVKWLNDQACLGWLEDVEVEKVVEQFKKDFEL